MLITKRLRKLVVFATFTMPLALFAANTSQYAVASANPYATKAGIQILTSGGNAFDAAITVASVLAVTEPYNSGIGGGGFWLFFDAKHQKYQFLDARETAPAKATQTMFDNNQSAINGSLAAGIPGEVAGLIYLHQHYAQLSLAKDLQPAITLAQAGFVVTPYYQKRAAFRLKSLRAFSQTSKIFLENNDIPAIGYLIKQPKLAKTLQLIASTEGDDFYRGKTAKDMVEAVQSTGGIWTLSDLDNYHVIIRKPIFIDYKNNQIITAPLPSAGGIALKTMLNLMNQTDFFSLSHIMQVHYMIEFMRNIYYDRYKYLGDPAFNQIPLKDLLSSQHATQILQRISPNKATASDTISSLDLSMNKEGMHTTHYSIIDAKGNIVSSTLSLNYPFGSGFVAGDTGVLLNDQMNDFAIGINKTNAYQLLGGEHNLIAPNKRPLSSMTPTIIQSPDKTVVLGTPGGSKIVTMLMLAVVSALEGKTATEIVTQPRYHMQFYPDIVTYEADTFNNVVLDKLIAMGYLMQKTKAPYGNMQVVIYNKKTHNLTAASDPRGEGISEVGQVPTLMRRNIKHNKN